VVTFPQSSRHDVIVETSRLPSRQGVLSEIANQLRIRQDYFARTGPRLRCHAAGCSQLWKQDSDDGDPVYPAQVLTDFVKGEVVGLTAVYDKSVSTEEIRAV
jgi:hypothetical protein